MNAPSASARRPRLALIGLAALFFVPLAASFYPYYGTGWRPSGGAQRGELIDPARPLPEVRLTRADGSATGTDFLRGDWHLVYVGAGDCDAPCRESLAKSRQVRLALDKDVNRVSRVFLYVGAAPAAGYLAGEHGDMVAASVTARTARGNDQDKIHIQQIFVRLPIFSDWLAQKESEPRIYIPLRGYFWRNSENETGFTAKDLEEFENNLEINQNGDASIIF